MALSFDPTIPLYTGVVHVVAKVDGGFKEYTHYYGPYQSKGAALSQANSRRNQINRYRSGTEMADSKVQLIEFTLKDI